MARRTARRTAGDGKPPERLSQVPQTTRKAATWLGIAHKRLRCLAGTDLLFAVILTCVLSLGVPARVPLGVVADLYMAGITVLSIVFSLFFAAVAVVLTGADDGFILFLEEEGGYSDIVWAFRAALGILFIGLLAFLLAYGRARFAAEAGQTDAYEPKLLLLFLSGLFLWGLFAAVYAANDCLIFATTRAEHLCATKRAVGTRRQ